MKIISFALCVMLVLCSNAYGGGGEKCQNDTIPTGKPRTVTVTGTGKAGITPILLTGSGYTPNVDVTIRVDDVAAVTTVGSGVVLVEWSRK